MPDFFIFALIENSIWKILSATLSLFYVDQALCAGARGYSSKERPQEFYTAIEQVLAGQLYLSPALNYSGKVHQASGANLHPQNW